MDKFYIEILNGKVGNQYTLYEPSGRVFFILKQKGNDYHTAQLSEYDPIKDQIKEWLLEEGIPQFYSRKLGSIKTSIDFEFSIITSIIRDNKLNELGI